MVERLVWTAAALSDLDEIVEYIARDDRERALSWMAEVFKLVEDIPSFPRRGRVVPEWRDESVREVIHGNYRIVYITSNPIHIVAVLHSRRDFLSAFPDGF